MDVPAGRGRSAFMDVGYEHPSALRFWCEMRRHGHPTAYATVMTALYGVASLGLAAHLTDTTERLLGRAPLGLAQFARATTPICGPTCPSESAERRRSPNGSCVGHSPAAR